MVGETVGFAMFLLAAAIAGACVGWLLHGGVSAAKTRRLRDAWQDRIDDLTRQRDRLTAETGNLRKRIEEQQGVLHRHERAAGQAQTDLESARERETRLQKDIFTLRGEREDTKKKMTQFQTALTSMKQQTTDLQNEFIKSREFYKGELQKSFEKRKELQAKLEDARAEQSSFQNLLKSSRSEHDSVNKMLQSAQARLSHLDQLEDKVIKLEAENAQLNHDARLAQQKIDVLERDVAELEELKVQNRELAHCLESMEESRRQYEDDAQRYRQYADQVEKKSETLALKLDEVEKNFMEIEKQQQSALRAARDEAANESLNGNGQDPEPQEVDDLKEIIGIGKVFERALNDLGIYSFRQIANFGPSDIARVNRELKECRGRMEQDDWIGQAKELAFKKYGAEAS
ncbi:MAG: hypothetical protein R3288_07695 [Woeseiaceae bacterium]|nr:hypothetical protein [Woeseiaceae bacterium]